MILTISIYNFFLFTCNLYIFFIYSSSFSFTNCTSKTMSRISRSLLENSLRNCGLFDKLSLIHVKIPCAKHNTRYFCFQVTSQCYLESVLFHIMDSITPITCFTCFSHSSCVSASTITRSNGSVPLARTKIRPLSPKASSTAFSAAITSG